MFKLGLNRDVSLSQGKLHVVVNECSHMFVCACVLHALHCSPSRGCSIQYRCRQAILLTFASRLHALQSDSFHHSAGHAQERAHVQEDRPQVQGEPTLPSSHSLMLFAAVHCARSVVCSHDIHYVWQGFMGIGLANSVIAIRHATSCVKGVVHAPITQHT
jgi:hypothetical protein